jgi:hypothetical protein
MFLCASTGSAKLFVKKKGMAITIAKKSFLAEARSAFWRNHGIQILPQGVLIFFGKVFG